ncbi:hypothetical protein ACL02P_22135 [Paenibacillus sp. MB22_1]|uniref:Uncharacterized protein n=1 Tax=Siminovitchia terrae TaxID=1914933 RepID=A0A429X9V5_SIMTE|nr:hypothetical protein [Siminovitchia terrae]RST60121.1 hypothetical protein D5F11_008650 [Siminovitchia terrae]
MEAQDEFVLVSAPNKTGEQFIKALRIKGIPYAAITNNETEKSRLTHLGVKHILMVDTVDRETWLIPELPVGKVYLFESSLPLICRYIQICRSWTGKPIYIITGSNNARLIYKGLGASYVIYTRSDDVSFLLDNES